MEHSYQTSYFTLVDQLLPRYLRKSDIYSSAVDFRQLLKYDGIYDVGWLTEFVCIPGTCPVARFKPLENGLYPMDIASAIAVLTLDIKIESNVRTKVLDLCCCPGSKYLYICDTMSRGCLSSKQNLLVGCDISEHRLKVCKSLLSKWRRFSSENTLAKMPRQLLFSCDGTILSSSNVGRLISDSVVMTLEESERGDRRHMNKSAQGREKKRLRDAEKTIVNEEEIQNFEYVLVDAECTHDGSYRHMLYIEDDTNETQQKKLKLDTSASGTLENRITVSCIDSHDSVSDQLDRPVKKRAKARFLENAASDIQSLQRRLILNGFRLLREGGTMVYSTCSFQAAQNEAIVQYLIEHEPTAELVPCGYVESYSSRCRNESHSTTTGPPTTSLLDSAVTDSANFSGGDSCSSCSSSGGSSDSLRTEITDSTKLRTGIADSPKLSKIFTATLKSLSDNAEPLATTEAPSTIPWGPEVLELEPAALVKTLAAASEQEIAELSSKICQYFSQLSSVPVEHGALAGTMKLSRRVGMSGLFVAKIRKRVTGTVGCAAASPAHSDRSVKLVAECTQSMFPSLGSD